MTKIEMKVLKGEEESRHTPVNSTDGWTRYFDSENNAYYWYNSLTGESQWDEDQTNYDNYDNYNETEENDKQSLLRSPSIPTSEIRDATSNAVSADEEEEEEEGDNVSPLNDDALYYWRFLYLNAILVEAPFCILEILVRVSILGILVIVKAVYSLIFYRNLVSVLPEIKRLWRDIALSLLAGLTLLVPGMILYVYRNFHPNRNWSVAHLPTLIGPVDCRRFLTLTIFGSASFAKNVFDPKLRSSTEVWSDSIFCFPRDIMNAFVRLLSRSGE